jgi:hypothetical protein
VASHLINDIIELGTQHGATDVIDDISVTTWPDTVRLGDACDNHALDTYEQFQSWADDADVSLRPAFKYRERDTLVSSESEMVLVLPVRCLALYVDDTLAGVAPHSNGTSVYTVEDALATLPSLRDGVRSDEPHNALTAQQNRPEPSTLEWE